MDKGPDRVVRSTLTILLAVLLMLGRAQGAGAATDGEATPAHFGAAARDLAARLWQPTLADNEQLIVRCGALVSAMGTFKELNCFGDPPLGSDERRVSDSILRLADRVTIVPARVNGVPTWVWFNFAAVMTGTPSGTVTRVVDNHLHQVATLGENYVAAQRLRGPEWACDEHILGNYYLVMVRVEADGSPSDIRVSGHKGTKRCAGVIRRAMEHGEFIPAWSDGQPRASIYLETYSHFHPT